MTTDVLGAPIKRVEDPRFITGKGRYLDDIQMTGMTYMAILRSPYAHANIRAIDVAAAKAMPGVITVITGSLVLITAGYSNEQIAPAFGLFGTVIGYMLGRMSNVPPAAGGNTPGPTERDNQ